MTDLEALARELTDTQRRAVRGALDTPEGFCLNPSPQEEECEEMEAMGVTGEDGWSDILTPLGIALRTYLREQGQ